MVELLSQSNFSLLHGASHPEELIEQAAALEMPHLGLVDRDAVYGLVRAHKAAREHGIHLVCGAHVTIEHRPPVALLVETARGWSSLCRLLTKGRHQAEKGFSRLSVSDLCSHAEGLTLVLLHGWEAPWAMPLRDAFGGRLEIALTQRQLPSDRARARAATSLSRALEAPMLATAQALMHVPERRPVLDVLTCIRRLTTLRSAGRSLAANASRHLLSREQFASRFADWPAAIRRPLEVAERCTFALDELQYQYPREVVPSGRTAIGWLRELVERGARMRYPAGVSDTVRQQLERELELIERMDFPSYFLTVHDIVAFARDRGILCQGRGSAANSAVCYVLGITAVDPTRASLLFERFISEERGEPPDIDVDFEHERREEVLQYVYEKYGRERAGLVNEVISYRMRSAVRDVGKVFGLSLDQVNRLARCTDRWSAGSAPLSELVQDAGLDPASLDVRNTLAISEAVRGFPRHLSIHVGGFVIAESSLVDLVPVEPAKMKDRTVIQWDKDDIDTLRFVKVDCLALGMLTAIRKSFEFLEAHYQRALTLATVPAEDPAVYDMFCRSDTVGVFQIESRGQMSMLARLRPRCFYDLVIEVAIFRPGPIQGGMVHPYLRRRQGKEPVSYAHPALEPILRRTLGVPLFQEQAMEMAIAVGGFTPGQADQLRRAMGKWRKKGTLGEIGEQLIEGMLARGITPQYAEAIHAQLQGFGEYGFPESHAASFALLVYVSGWIKCYYPDVFCAALINSQPMGFYSPRSLVADAQHHGVQVRPVCVVVSMWDCTLEPTGERHAIRLGLRLVRGLGEEAAARLVTARERGPFRDLADLARRTALDRGSLQALAEADAFAGLGVERRRAAWILQGLWTELPLFAGITRREPRAQLPKETPAEQVQSAYRTVGLSVDLHPVELVREELARSDLTRLDALPRAGAVRVVGLVSNRQRPGTAKGVVFLTLEDESGMLNVVVWPSVWSRHRVLARDAVIVGIDGVIQRQDDAVSLLAERFWAVDTGASLPRVSRDFK